MKIKSILLSLAIIIAIVAVYSFQSTEQKTHKHNVVVTFTILEDFAKQLLKDVPEVHICSLVDCNQDPHSFQPHPKICALLKKADIMVINGLDFEHWFPAYREQVLGRLVIASDGIVPLRQTHNPALFDPHAWHDVSNAIIYVRNMRNAFKEVYPQFAKTIECNYQRFLQELQQLHAWIPQQFSHIKNRTIITTHDAFWYYGKMYGIQFISPQGISTEEEIAAAKMAQIVRIVKQNNVKALFLENLSNSAAIKQLAEETNTQIGGTLYADSLSKSDGPCPSYISMVRHNTKNIQKALGSTHKMEKTHASY
jgi:zinc/manganese transport system substrate-binding protein